MVAASVRGDDLPAYPDTPQRPVIDTYHGIQITDEYRWLEDLSGPDVRMWNDKENSFARAFLESIPDRAAIRRQLEELYNNVSSRYYGLKYQGGYIFAYKSQPPLQQPLLVLLGSVDEPGNERILLDINKLDSTGTTAIDFFVPSHDGKLIAVSESKGGSEDGTVYVYDIATGRQLDDEIPHVNGPTAGGSVAWARDGSGFYYTRYPSIDERPAEDLRFFQQVYYHKLGTPIAQDTYAIGADFPKIAEIALATSDDGKYFLAKVANGDGGEFAHFLLGPSGVWKQLTNFEDGITDAQFGDDNALYFLSIHDAPFGKILRMPLDNPDMTNAAVVVPQGDGVVEKFVTTPDYILVADLMGGISEIHVYDRKKDSTWKVPILPTSSVGEMLSIGGDTVLYSNSSYTEPAAWYRYEVTTDHNSRTPLYVTSNADFSNVEVIREFATSKDGTKIPMSIIRPVGVPLDGNNPTILYGYGGYGINMTPSFDPVLSLWLNQGGIYVVANLRGGGEYGEEWHKAGALTNKQNVFDDFAACAKYLIDKKYTSSKRLAIKGGSNGGLLMGAVLTQHPELFKAVISSVGIYDMLRVELDPNGAFNVTEFGSVKDLEQYKALAGYSPYHHVVNGTSYPAVLFQTGENDGRVNPANSRKMTAALQAATISGLPVLLRSDATAGHGVGSSLKQRIERDTDSYSFVFYELGVKYIRDKK